MIGCIFFIQLFTIMNLSFSVKYMSLLHGVDVYTRKLQKKLFLLGHTNVCICSSCYYYYLFNSVILILLLVNTKTRWRHFVRDDVILNKFCLLNECYRETCNMKSFLCIKLLKLIYGISKIGNLFIFKMQTNGRISPDT